ncbi:hypothetical protein QA596_12035 [Balneolales bacterium ANBcel1]|nr:hypothetical protein [Balneolales bacterium ANBcel1]
MNIYVGNLAWKTRRKELKELFENFGEVTNAFIVRDKKTRRSRGFGFVEMAEDGEAQEAIEKLNNTVFLERTIVVNEALPKEEGDDGANESPTDVNEDEYVGNAVDEAADTSADSSTGEEEAGGDAGHDEQSASTETVSSGEELAADGEDASRDEMAPGADRDSGDDEPSVASEETPSAVESDSDESGEDSNDDSGKNQEKGT